MVDHGFTAAHDKRAFFLSVESERNLDAPRLKLFKVNIQESHDATIQRRDFMMASLAAAPPGNCEPRVIVTTTHVRLLIQSRVSPPGHASPSSGLLPPSSRLRADRDIVTVTSPGRRN